MELDSLVAPGRTALLTMEMQRGVVGDLSPIAALVSEVDGSGVIANTARLAAAARKRGLRVVHCTAQFRADRAGSAVNCPMLSSLTKNPDHLLVGSPAADIVPELGPEPSDLFSSRCHGVSPFSGTALDIMLRNLGVATVIATGVSVNLGIIGLTIEAVNLGYHVVVATDAVAGVPADYATQVMDNTIALLATRVTVDELIGVWDPPVTGPTDDGASSDAATGKGPATGTAT